MKRFVEGIDRGQATLFPACLADWIDENNPVQVIDVFVEELDLAALGFDGVAPEVTGRPSYHPSVLLKLYLYGYLNRVQSSRRLEREAGRNVEVMWLTGRLVPDHKTIADFRKEYGGAIRKMCAQFIMLCRRLDLFADASMVIDGSKFKAVNNRDRNFTRAKMERRLAQIEESVARYLQQLDSVDRQEPSEARETKTAHLKEKIVKLKQEVQRLNGLKAQMLAAPDQQISLTDPDSRSMATSGRGSGIVGYNVQVAVDTKHHLIVTHEVTNVGNDRAQLARMAMQTKATLEAESLDVIADLSVVAQQGSRRRQIQISNIATETRIDRSLNLLNRCISTPAAKFAKRKIHVPNPSPGVAWAQPESLHGVRDRFFATSKRPFCIAHH